MIKYKYILACIFFVFIGYLFIHILANISYTTINIYKDSVHNLKVKGINVTDEIFVMDEQAKTVDNTDYADQITSTYGTNNTAQNETSTLKVTISEEMFDETKLTESTLLKLKELLQCDQRKLRSFKYMRRHYWVLQNFQAAEEMNIECHSTLTYVTHGEFTFMSNLEYLLARWNAPISFALYAPGYDMETTVNSIRYVRDCSTVKDLVRKWVSFHIYFRVDHMPENIPNVSQVFNCSEIAPYMIKDSSSSYKNNKSLIYPVNVGRNIARDASVTHYYLMLDIELYPTPNLAARFLNMIARNHTLADGNWNKVFVVPPFEIEADQMIPDNKTQLLQMLNAKSAIKFHQNLCSTCHTVAFYDKWIQQGQTKDLEITGIGKRVGPYYNWEPLFISTHSEPYVDERLSWDGMRDKMTMSYVLCLLDYDFLVLSNAFVVHHPGIKNKSQLPNATRKQLVHKQSKFINSVIKKELQVVYPTRQGCVL